MYTFLVLYIIFGASVFAFGFDGATLELFWGLFSSAPCSSDMVCALCMGAGGGAITGNAVFGGTGC